MKKCVIFDLDGTLVHSLPDIAAAMNRSLQKYGLPAIEESAFKYKVGNGVLKLTERCIGEHKELYQQVLEAYKADYAVNNQVNSHAFKGVPDMLKALTEKGVDVCVLTNKDQADAERVLAHYFPDVRFSVIRGRTEGVPLKPDPAGALLIAEKLGLTKDDCWYAGDTNTDMKCGNAAGMETIGVLWGYRPREELTANGARHLVSEPNEIVDLVTA
ncbi:MAG: HAD family hydrolase [Clostridia bacterium]|nr:HAD family hydrolase [Clostridia bacterium]